MNENEKHRVLLIDDDINYCEVIGQRLSGRFDVCFESTLNGGIRQMDNREPDAVLLDLKLPDSSPVDTQTLALLKQHRHRAAIIILTGNPDPELAYQMIQGNASGYLVKGRHDVDPESFAKDIVSAIESQRFCETMRAKSNPNKL